MAIKTRIFRVIQDQSDVLNTLAISIADDGVLLSPNITITSFPSLLTTGLPAGVLSVNVGANNNGVVVGILEFDDDIINGNVFIGYSSMYTSGAYNGSVPTKIIPCVPPVIPPPPIARVTNTYLGTTNQGDFTGTFHITENDDATPLQIGDEVTLTFRSGTNNYFLGEATFPYGANLATATPLVDNGFVANLRPYFASGSILQHGGSYVFLKKPFAHNWHNTHTGAMAGINLGEEIIIEIKAKDTSTSQTSSNVDNTTNLRVLYNIINTNTGGSRGGAPTSAQMGFFGQWENGLQVANATSAQVTTNGITGTFPLIAGVLSQPDTGIYEDRIFTGMLRNSPFGFTNVSCPLPFAPQLTATNRWQKEGTVYITTRVFTQTGIQNETTRTTTFTRNTRAYQWSTQWGTVMTQNFTRIALNAGDNPSINFTQYNHVLDFTGNSFTQPNFSHTFPTDGIYDTSAEIHTDQLSQPASYARDQIIVYSY